MTLFTTNKKLFFLLPKLLLQHSDVILTRNCLILISQMKSFYAAIQIGNKLELEQQECRLQIFFTNNARHSFHNLNLDEEKFN
jgi:hypothetical protein